MRTPENLTIEDHPSAELWGVDEPTLARWPSLVPGTEVTVVKRSTVQHGPAFRVDYPATVVASDLPSPWQVAKATWVAGTIRQAHLTFENDDVLLEVFSPIHPYNAFAVYTPEGALKGWYANTVYPTVIEERDGHLEVVWNDLFIDVVSTPDGEVAVLDEDELDEANLKSSDPELHARILAARDELLERFRERRAPFTSPDRLNISRSWTKRSTVEP